MNAAIKIVAARKAARHLVPSAVAASKSTQPVKPGTSVPKRTREEPATAAPIVAQPACIPGTYRPEESPGPTVSSISDQLRPGRLLGSFELQRQLENGSTGATWLAQDYSVRRQAGQVALKFLPDVIVSDKIAFGALKSDIGHIIALKHPNILRVYDLVETKGRVAIQMEYQEGQSLSRLRLTKPNQIFEVEDLKDWVKGLCEALECAHKDFGLIDGEIGPDNLLIDLTGKLRLKEFGISNRITDSISRLTAIHHTSEIAPYNSPQRAAGDKPATTDDLYSLGAILYELLTGLPPFYAGDIEAQVSGKIPPSMTERRAERGITGEAIPKNWEETVVACLAKDPAQRPQSASEVEKQLQNRSSPSPVASESPAKSVGSTSTKPQPAVRNPLKSKSWRAIAGITFVLAFVLVIPFFAFHRRTEPKFGSIVLDTIPAGANVLVDGTSRGTTPLFVGDVAAGDRQLRIELRGYEPQVLKVAIKQGQEVFRLFHLVPARESFSASPDSQSPSGSTKKESRQLEALPSLVPSPTPSAVPSPTPSPVPSPTPSAVLSPTPSLPAAGASIQIQPPATSPTPLNQEKIDKGKEEAIKRIDALPGVTADKKADLIEKMQKARSMERLIVIPFEFGQISLHRPATDDVLKAFNTPEMRDKLSDPTLVLVIAGYSDMAGRSDRNLHISQQRADNVSRILKERVMLPNAMETIGMGGTELLDSGHPDQNRAVEVWAVVPL
jgi:serine/threonine protein kinase